LATGREFGIGLEVFAKLVGVACFGSSFLISAVLLLKALIFCSTLWAARFFFQISLLLSFSCFCSIIFLSSASLVPYFVKFDYGFWVCLSSTLAGVATGLASIFWPDVLFSYLTAPFLI
jgi:hypothetical protein